MNTIIQFLIHTPWYVYVILAYMISVGIKAVKGGTVSLKKLYILPIIFILMSIDELIGSFYFEPLQILVAFIAAIIGAYLLGWLPYSRLNIQADKDKEVLIVEGSWFSLALIILTFVVKYAIGAILAMHENLTLNETYLLIFISTLFTGAFIGRLFYALRLLDKV